MISDSECEMCETYIVDKKAKWHEIYFGDMIGICVFYFQSDCEAYCVDISDQDDSFIHFSCKEFIQFVKWLKYHSNYQSIDNSFGDIAGSDSLPESILYIRWEPKKINI